MTSADSQNQVATPDPAVTVPKPTRKAPKKPAKKAAPAKAKSPGSKRKPEASKPQTKATTDRPNKKAEVIAMMKRAKGASLAEIMDATGWQPHTVRGFVSILGSKDGQSIESSNSANGERTYRITK